LYMAVYYKYFDVVQLLLRKGANPRLRVPGFSSCLQEAARSGHSDVVQLLLESWGQPQITVGDLVDAAKVVSWSRHKSTFTLLARELRKLYPAQVHQLFEFWSPFRPAAAVAAMLDAWASDVRSLDEQWAAVRKRKEAVASEQQVVQQLIVAVAGVAKDHAVAQQQDLDDSTHMAALSEAVQLQQLQL
jgi:hypothetical protein